MTEVFALLNDGQREMISPTVVRGRLGIDMISPGLIRVQQVRLGWPATKTEHDPESDRDLLIRSVRWVLGKPPVDRKR